MVLYKNHEKNVVYYNAMIASTKNYEFSKKKNGRVKITGYTRSLSQP